MSYEESNARKKSQQYFRTSMDIGMGLFYSIIGALLLISKSFAGMSIPPVISYILGGMMLIGGGFRFYRGVKVLLSKRNPPNPQN